MHPLHFIFTSFLAKTIGFRVFDAKVAELSCNVDVVAVAGNAIAKAIGASTAISDFFMIKSLIIDGVITTYRIFSG